MTQAAAQTQKTPEEVWALLETVMDPELPVVSVVELGVVREVMVEGGRVRVTLTPTFSACPALRVMQDEIRGVLEPFFHRGRPCNEAVAPLEQRLDRRERAGEAASVRDRAAAAER